MRRNTALIALATTATLLLGACSGSNKPSTAASNPAADQAAGGTSGPHKKGGTVTISNEQGQTWPCAFNPFNPANSAESLGFIYEPLIHVDVVGNSKETPMLATGYQWSADSKSIVFTIRSGVKWSDGQPDTADD
jgi:peptide/nickel transport system substrate-binding protein